MKFSPDEIDLANNIIPYDPFNPNDELVFSSVVQHQRDLLSAVFRREGCGVSDGVDAATGQYTMTVSRFDQIAALAQAGIEGAQCCMQNYLNGKSHDPNFASHGIVLFPERDGQTRRNIACALSALGAYKVSNHYDAALQSDVIEVTDINDIRTLAAQKVTAAMDALPYVNVIIPSPGKAVPYNGQPSPGSYVAVPHPVSYLDSLTPDPALLKTSGIIRYKSMLPTTLTKASQSLKALGVVMVREEFSPVNGELTAVEVANRLDINTLAGHRVRDAVTAQAVLGMSPSTQPGHLTLTPLQQQHVNILNRAGFDATEAANGMIVYTCADSLNPAKLSFVESGVLKDSLQALGAASADQGFRTGVLYTVELSDAAEITKLASLGVKAAIEANKVHQSRAAGSRGASVNPTPPNPNMILLASENDRRQVAADIKWLGQWTWERGEYHGKTCLFSKDNGITEDDITLGPLYRSLGLVGCSGVVIDHPDISTSTFNVIIPNDDVRLLSSLGFAPAQKIFPIDPASLKAAPTVTTGGTTPSTAVSVSTVASGGAGFSSKDPYVEEAIDWLNTKSEGLYFDARESKLISLCGGDSESDDMGLRPIKSMLSWAGIHKDIKPQLCTAGDGTDKKWRLVVSDTNDLQALKANGLHVLANATINSRDYLVI